jgi:hypothetical protein
MFKKSQLPQS